VTGTPPWRMIRKNKSEVEKRSGCKNDYSISLSPFISLPGKTRPLFEMVSMYYYLNNFESEGLIFSLFRAAIF
jgi:hypothetical protein